RVVGMRINADRIHVRPAGDLEQIIYALGDRQRMLLLEFLDCGEDLQAGSVEIRQRLPVFQVFDFVRLERDLEENFHDTVNREVIFLLDANRAQFETALRLDHDEIARVDSHSCGSDHLSTIFYQLRMSGQVTTISASSLSRRTSFRQLRSAFWSWRRSRRSRALGTGLP